MSTNLMRGESINLTTGKVEKAPECEPCAEIIRHGLERNDFQALAYLFSRDLFTATSVEEVWA